MNIDLSPRCRILAVLAVVGLGLLAGGCRSKGIAASQPINDAQSAAWRIRPVAVRVYPSTRFIREPQRSLLEARIEFVDEVGDPIKAVGWVRFDLFPVGKPGERPMNRPVYTWEDSILTCEQNRQRFDSITGGYLFPLKLDNLSIAQQPIRLMVTFVGHDGARLTAETVMGVEPPTAHVP